MITKTDAFVIKSMRYRDTSRIVTFYSQRFGKIKGIAKGARDTKSKFGGSLEPATLASLVLYRKEHRDLHLISQGDVIRHYKTIHGDMDRMEVALSVLELVDQVVHDEEENRALYSLMLDAFESLEVASGNHLMYLHAFMLRMASVFGFRPAFMVCPECKNPIRTNESTPSHILDLGKGGVYCKNCAIKLGTNVLPGQSRVRISAQTASILGQLLEAQHSTLGSITYNKFIGNELDETLRLYLQYHFDGLRPLKTKAVFQQING